MILLIFGVYKDPVSEKNIECTHLRGVGNLYGWICFKNGKFSEISQKIYCAWTIYVQIKDIYMNLILLNNLWKK